MALAQKLLPRGSRRRATARKQARRFFRYMRKLEKRLLAQETSRVAQESSRADVGKRKSTLDSEEGKLKTSWARHASDDLAEYLVSGYQNPRINAQSILARHFLVRRLFGSEFDQLMEEEFQFCIETNEAIRLRASEQGVKMGAFLDPQKRAAVQRVCEVIADREREFEVRWQATLAGRTAERLKVIEFACGSANDYRALADYGIAQYLDYTGVDLNEKNVANAEERFADAEFRVGSILDLPFPDRSFDYVLAFDIFEHLSLHAMEQALKEATRLADKGLVLAFFIMTDAPEHTERPRNTYHWNELSAGKIKGVLSRDFSDVWVQHIPSLLSEKYGYEHSYNKRAYTIIAEGRR